MALINCPNCGHPISDKATQCPKCGAKRVVDSRQETAIQQDNLSQQEVAPQQETATYAEQEAAELSNQPVEEVLFTYEEPEEPEKGKRKILLYVVIALLSLCVVGAGIGFFVYFGDKKDRAKTDNETLEQEDQSVLDAEAEEAARLDSLRQEAINARNFTTQDLTFFEVHGKVKDITYNSTNGPVADLLNGDKFEFDNNGNLINKKERLAIAKPDGQTVYRWQYNSNGFPVNGEFAESGAYQEQSWVWNNNGQLKKSFNCFGSHSIQNEYLYDENNDLVHIRMSERASMGYENTMNVDVSIVKRDQMGNWVERKHKRKIIERYQPISDEDVPNEGFKSVYEDGMRIFEKNTTEVRTEKRTINYY